MQGCIHNSFTLEKLVVLGPRLRGFIFWSRVMIGSLTQYRDITPNSCPDCMRVCYSMKVILDGC